jgi:hypothetical protein
MVQYWRLTRVDTMTDLAHLLTAGATWFPCTAFGVGRWLFLAGWTWPEEPQVWAVVRAHDGLQVTTLDAGSMSTDAVRTFLFDLGHPKWEAMTASPDGRLDVASRVQTKASHRHCEWCV